MKTNSNSLPEERM